METLGFILISLIAGWIAELIMQSHNSGMIISIILGVFGAIIGGYVVDSFGLSIGGGVIVRILVATSGAIMLILFLRLIWKLWADKSIPTPSFLPVWYCMLLTTIW